MMDPAASNLAPRIRSQRSLGLKLGLKKTPGIPTLVSSYNHWITILIGFQEKKEVRCHNFSSLVLILISNYR